MARSIVSLLFVALVAFGFDRAIGFSVSVSVQQGRRGMVAAPTVSTLSSSLSIRLWATRGDNEGAKKKKRKRRRKDRPTTSDSSPLTPTSSPDPIKTSQEQIEGIDKIGDDLTDEDDGIASASSENESLQFEVSVGDGGGSSGPVGKEELLQLEDIAKFEFKPDSEISLPGIEDEPIQSTATASEESGNSDNTAIPLPDIREARRRKEIEEELARTEQEKEEQKVKIKRSDKEAFRKLLEAQPFADADDSFFEEEEYGTVSALLGEGTKPFLGIPPGPLQVGHFIGALGIMLMAFVEYPGFPLTNLPTPLRDALQGGLASVYFINTILAVLSTFKAGERGQPKVLWASKTFAVGGLALDQLTQLPTLDQIEKAKSVKGKRALKNRKR